MVLLSLFAPSSRFLSLSLCVCADVVVCMPGKCEQEFMPVDVLRSFRCHATTSTEHPLCAEHNVMCTEMYIPRLIDNFYETLTDWTDSNDIRLLGFCPFIIAALSARTIEIQHFFSYHSNRINNSVNRYGVVEMVASPIVCVCISVISGAVFFGSLSPSSSFSLCVFI